MWSVQFNRGCFIVACAGVTQRRREYKDGCRAGGLADTYAQRNSAEAMSMCFREEVRAVDICKMLATRQVE